MNCAMTMMVMSRQSEAEKKIAELYGDLSRRAGASPFGSCPVDLTAAFLRMCLAQSCGKCVPCRVGLDRLQGLVEKVLGGEGTMEDFAAVKSCAQAIYDSADCAIGFEAAKLVLDGLVAFNDDYVSHIEKGVCTANFGSVPCQTGCPAHVNIPGYIACIAAGRYADAVRVIRQTNPFPAVCGLICEHPCEKYCRRNVVDDAINIRGLKRYAVEKAGDVPAPKCAPKNGKTVGIVGGGPAGLTAAYFLALKGFEVTVYEKRPKLGGMLRYGIPAYRLPDADLDRDIDVILSTGVKVEFGKTVGKDISFADFRKTFDAVYISIGAHGAKKLGIEGEDAKGVLSAVELLGAVGGTTIGVSGGPEPLPVDFSGKRVVIVGGGNVAMDATRTSKRLGAASVTCVYRRRIVDMTALPEEVAGAQAEGCEVLQLMAPVKVAVKDGAVTGLVVKPQIAGAIKGGRPSPVNSSDPEETIPCDIIIVAIGQDIDSKAFAADGVDEKRGALVASGAGEVKAGGEKMKGVF
ncbi:MAG: FAD-dependent oxidoreductase, partial [bacterium]|nr:FAD-dependent oxidoreductase [Candidatus Colisoma equi]